MPRPSKMRHTSADTAPGGPVFDLNSHIATRVAVFANRLSRAASRFYRKNYGIGVVEWRLIMYIGRAKETRAKQTASRKKSGAKKSGAKQSSARKKSSAKKSAGAAVGSSGVRKVSTTRPT